MDKPKFVYVTYIRTTQQKLWDALTKPEFTRQFFMGTWQDCTWEKGASWKMIRDNGEVTDRGEVLEIDPPNRIVLAWTNAFRPELKEETPSRMTYLLENMGDAMKLTVIHESNTPGSKLIEAVSGGWPLILSSLKSFLESGTPLPESLKPCKV